MPPKFKRPKINWKQPKRLRRQLKNTMAKKSCPDPSLIYVDPEEGYSCGQEPNPEEVKAAWVAACEERQRGVGPEANPCVPPTFAYNDARFIKACRVTQGADERA